MKLFFVVTLLFFTPLCYSKVAPPSLIEQAKLAPSNRSAETLYSLHHSEMDAQGFWKETRYFSIRINDIDAARDYGRIVLRFDDFYSDMSLDFARVLTNQGELKSVDEDAIKYGSVGANQDFYNDLSEISFSLPQIEAGSIIEFQFSRTTTKLAISTLHADQSSPYWYQPYSAGDGWRADTVLHYQYTQIIPEGKVLHTKIYGDQPKTPLVSRSQNTVSRVWTWKDVPALVIEGAMPPNFEVAASIRSSSEQSWEKVDAWFWEKVKNKLSLPPEVERLVTKLKLENATELARIQAVYAYMQNNIRYVYAHVGRGGYDPHFPSEIVDEKYGDCKDQTVLALAMLEALDVKAFPILVETPNAGKSDTSLASLIFDHVFVYIPATENRSEIFMDTTGDRQMFPGVSGYLHDQVALIVNGEGGELISLNFDPSNNHESLNLVFNINEKRQAEVSFLLEYSGIFEERMRSWWKHTNHRETHMQQLFSSIYENQNQYDVDYRAFNEDSLSEPFYIEGTFTFREPIPANEPVNFGASVGQLLRTFGLASDYQVPETRVNRFVSPIGFQATLNAKFNAVEGSAQAVVSSADDIRNEYFDVIHNLDNNGDGYELRTEFIQKPLDLVTTEYANFYTELVSIGDNGGWVVSAQADSSTQSESELDALKRSEGVNSVAYTLKLAKQKIDLGEFELALPLAKTSCRN